MCQSGWSAIKVHKLSTHAWTHSSKGYNNQQSAFLTSQLQRPQILTSYPHHLQIAYSWFWNRVFWWEFEQTVRTCSQEDELIVYSNCLHGIFNGSRYSTKIFPIFSAEGQLLWLLVCFSVHPACSYNKATPYSHLPPHP